AGAELLPAIPRSDHPRPREEDRLAGPALVGGLLGTERESLRVGILDPAVVGEVDHEGVFGEPLLLELAEKLTAGLVEPFDHRIVAGDMIGGDALGLVLFK